MLDHLMGAGHTYIPVQRGFLYLVAIMDWATRHVLAWRLSNTMDASFCVEALAEALSKYGKPEIFKPDSIAHERNSMAPGATSKSVCPLKSGWPVRRRITPSRSK
jgi:transposase InsO family protein